MHKNVSYKIELLHNVCFGSLMNFLMGSFRLLGLCKRGLHIRYELFWVFSLNSGIWFLNLYKDLIVAQRCKITMQERSNEWRIKNNLN